MVGPYFLALASLKRDARRIAVSRKSAKYGVENEVGLTFGVYQVRQVLEDVRNFFDALTKEISEPFVFLVTSYPGENDVLDIFEEQLNIWGGADPSKSSLIKFLREVWSLDEIEDMIVALWDSMVIELGSMSDYTMTFDAFIDRLKNYYSKHRTSPGPEGLFRISKGSPDQVAERIRCEDIPHGS